MTTHGSGRRAPFVGVIRQQPDAGNLEVVKNGGADAVVPGIHRQTKREVCVNSVSAGVLEAIGIQLVQKSDPPTFVATRIDENTATFTAYCTKSLI